jgi:hypothetical protein
VTYGFKRKGELEVSILRLRRRVDTRTVALLFFGLFHHFVTFASSTQQLVFRNFRLAYVY